MSSSYFRDLRKTFPSSSSARYQYEKLKDSNIRLMKLLPYRKDDPTAPIECELRSTPLKDIRTYWALSYAWGKEMQENSLIVNLFSLSTAWSSNSVPITPNLYAALKSLRLANTAVWLWVDQVCINQQDAKERSAQVDIMRTIYAKAERTIVWLGYANADTEVLISVIEELKNRMPQPHPGRDVQEEPSHRSVRDRDLLKVILQGEKTSKGITWSRRETLIRFLGREWFRRAWVYQEAMMATKVEVIWGRLRVSFDVVAAVVLSAYSLFKSEEGGHWYKRLKETKGFGPLRSIYFDRQVHWTSLDFLDILWRARKYLLATDQRDMVYAFLGFQGFRKGLEIRADYAVERGGPEYVWAVEDTFIGLARSAIANSHDLRILSCIAPSKHPIHKLPSWVPNWTERRFTCGSPIFHPGIKNAFEACREKRHVFVASDPRHLIVEGYIIAHIQSLMEHKINNCYSHARVSDAIGLDQLVAEVLHKAKSLEIECSAELKSSIRQYTDNAELRKVLLRVILADGAFSDEQPIKASMLDELLRVYQHIASFSEVKVFSEHQSYQYLRQTASVSHGKAVFLTDGLNLGLAYANVRPGDVVCVLYGSSTPCILRRSSRMTVGCYKFMGLCYMDGCMFGETMSDRERKPTTFTLV